MITIGLPNIAASDRILQNYIDALTAAGALAKVLEVTTSEDRIRHFLDECDGVVLIGGADIPAGQYGSQRHPAMRAVLSPEQAFFYTTLARAVILETSKPVLGVCLGNQMINVALGGTLYEDICTEIPGAQWHSRPIDNHQLETMHVVRFPVDSPLCRIIGSTELCVNSSHHQAIRTVAPGMKVAAWASDGVAEAICPEVETGRFLLGVQWHPERIFNTIGGHFRIIQALVSACSAPEVKVIPPRMTVLKDGMVCDGTGTAIVRKDVLIQDDIILDIVEPGTPLPTDACIVDSANKLVTPGFIDAHAHSEIRKLKYPEFRTKLLQGVTTEVNGNCGSNAACVPGQFGQYRWQSLQEYTELLDGSGQSTNSVILCGHNAIRHAVMGNASREPTADEMQRMIALLKQSLAIGAAGMSSGLTYFPGKFASTSELVTLARELKGKVYATHVRNEGDRLVEAAEEAIQIARQAGCPLQYSHLKTMFSRNHHKLGALLDCLEKARAAGMSIQADRYPYVHSQTSLRQILPAPLDRIPEISQYIKESRSHYEEVVQSLKQSPRDLSTTIILDAPFKGRTLLDVSVQSGRSMEEIAADLLRDVPQCEAAYLAMSEENLDIILGQSWVCPGSDGLTLQLDEPGTFGHPRAVATFPHYFRRVSAAVGIPETIRRMTSLPASIFNIPKRGVLQPGYKADIVVMDPKTFDSPAGFASASFMPSGISQIFVSGVLTYDCAAPGKIGHAGRYIPVS